MNGICKIFLTLFHSVLKSIGFDPGLVDSPPTSTMSAPFLKREFNLFLARLSLKYFPPSEKLSGVIFKTPIILGHKFMLRPLNFFFFMMFLKSIFIFFFKSLFKYLIFLIEIFFFDFFVIISIQSKEIS